MVEAENLAWNDRENGKRIEAQELVYLRIVYPKPWALFRRECSIGYMAR